MSLPSLLPAAAPRSRMLLRRAARMVLPLLALAGHARAGDYHRNDTLRCSQCHVMHFSQNRVPGPGPVPLRLGGLAQPSLLRASVNDLCTSCHDGSLVATDVLGAENTGSQLGIVRAAGYLAREGLTFAPHGGHRLDSLDFAPGSSPPWSPASESGTGVGLTCIHCHDPHGEPGAGHPTGDQYRNLRSDPGFSTRLWVTTNANPGLNDLTRDVFVRAANGYDESQVDWNEPNSRESAIARWCLACHTDMHRGGAAVIGSPGNPLPPLPAHPFEGENLESGMIARLDSRVNKVKVLSEFGQWNPVGSGATPTCITCHRGHGNGNPAGLIFRSGTGLATEDGDTDGSTMADLCNQCHSGTPN